MTPQNTFTIFIGDNGKTLFARALNTGCNTRPLNLTDCTEIVIQLPKADGTFTELKLTAGGVVITSPGILGEYSAPIPDTVSNLLNPGELQDFDVTFTIAGVEFTVRYFQGISVFERH